jgi:hypothetical protein
MPFNAELARRHAHAWIATLTTRGSIRPIFEGFVPIGFLVRWSDDDADPPAAVRERVAMELRRHTRNRTMN